ncbi:MAG: IS5 family transposase, partial [Planctomycetota bacterium]
MSKTTKSPRKVLVAAYATAQNVLPAYSHRFSPHKFTLPQLFACLVLKTFLKADYRGVVELLRDCPDLRKAIHLDHTPHFTTLQKASRKLLRLPVANRLLLQTGRSVLKNKTVPLAAIDSTGLEAGHISRYFVRRKRSKQLPYCENTLYRRYPKLALVCDCRNHIILGAIATRGPSVDVNQFCASLKPVAENFRLQYILADAGYDSESNHRYARDCYQITSIIPAKHGRPTTKLSTKKYRRLMQTDFDKEKYGQRWQVETVFSMIKRRLGSVLHSRSYWAQNREMLLMVLTHNLAIILLVKELFYRA